MNWNEFNAIPNGTQVLNHGWDQCVALANLYNEGVVGGGFVPVGSAYQWWTDFDYFPQLYQNYTRSGTPVAGAIFVSRYGLYDAPDGHIGVVTSVNSDGTFNTMEQNAGTWRYVGRYTRDYTNMLGFLIPKNNPATPKPPVKKARKQKNMLMAYYKDAAGKGKGRWVVFAPGFWLELETQKAANAFAAQLGNIDSFVTDAGGWAKFKRVSGA